MVFQRFQCRYSSFSKGFRVSRWQGRACIRWLGRARIRQLSYSRIRWLGRARIRFGILLTFDVDSQQQVHIHVA